MNEIGLLDKLLVFTLNNESYGIMITNVKEIIEYRKVVGVPELPDYIHGVINLRNRVIPIMDLRLRFGLPKKDVSDQTSIIIVNHGTLDVGLIVDQVDEVISVDPETFSAPPALNNDFHPELIYGLCNLGDSIVILINTHTIITASGLEGLPTQVRFIDS